PHQVAQKSTTTILPRRLARLMGVPSAAWKESSGLSPTSTAAKERGAKQTSTARVKNSFLMSNNPVSEMAADKSLTLRSVRRHTKVEVQLRSEQFVGLRFDLRADFVGEGGEQPGEIDADDNV